MGATMAAGTHSHAKKSTRRGLSVPRRSERASEPVSGTQEHQVRNTVVGGVLGGGLLGAGFGPLAATGGMILGGLAGYLVERRLARLGQQASS